MKEHCWELQREVEIEKHSWDMAILELLMEQRGRRQFSGPVSWEAFWAHPLSNIDSTRSLLILLFSMAHEIWEPEDLFLLIIYVCTTI